MTMYHPPQPEKEPPRPEPAPSPRGSHEELDALRRWKTEAIIALEAWLWVIEIRVGGTDVTVAIDIANAQEMTRRLLEKKP